MATIVQFHRLELFPGAIDKSCPWLESAATPWEEARDLFAGIESNADTVESIRELIEVPPRIEEALWRYARRYPEDAQGIERVLEFRRCVREEFERLVAAGRRN
jgi:hypothetical protein